MAGSETLVNKDTTLAEICKHPRAGEILAKYRLPCLHCPMASREMGHLKIGDVCQMYGLDLDNLLRELNEETEKGHAPSAFAKDSADRSARK